MSNLDLTPEEEAKLNAEFPQGNEPKEEVKSTEPVTPTEEPKKEEESTVSQEEILGALQSLGLQLEDLKKKEESATPEKPEGWVPKNWEEVKATTEEVAKKAVEDKAKEAVDAEKEKEAAMEKLDREIGNRVEALEKAGLLPKMVDSKSDTDPGVAARKELFAFASQFNSMDFDLMMKNMKPMHDQGLFFDHKTFQWTKKVANDGKDAPIASSSTTTTPTGIEPDYKMIHKMNFDQLADIGMRE